MNICLCNLSADAVLEFAAQKGIELEPATPDPRSFSADPSIVSQTLYGIADIVPKPIELLVGSAEDRRPSAGVSCRLWKGPLVQNSVYIIDDGVYVTSPELTLLMQATQLHQANLCQMLGRYLGTWTPRPDMRNGQDERAPLTTFEDLNFFLSSVGRAMGKSNLRLAMAYTAEGAASAPETSLQLALTLPPELHGCGLMLPNMNYEVELSAHGQRMYPHATTRVDVCWRDALFGLEYQGPDHRTQLGGDYARWMALHEQGYELWFVAKEQLASAVQMDYIAREAAQRIGFAIDEALWPTESELQDLLDTLRGAQHPKPVACGELRKRQLAIRAHKRKSRREL